MRAENSAVDRESVRVQCATFQTVQSLLCLPLSYAEAHILRFASTIPPYRPDTSYSVGICCGCSLALVQCIYIFGPKQQLALPLGQ